MTIPGLSGPIEIETAQGADAAIARWRDLRAQSDQTNIYPVIIDPEFEDDGDRDDEIAWLLEEGKTRESILAKATPDRIEKWQAKRSKEFASYGEGDFPPRGDFPEDMDPQDASFASLHDVHGEPLESVTIALVPARTSWEAIAELGFGGFNDCPPTETQAAYLRHWNEQHGADLFAVLNDTLECMVHRPPTTREEALTLAEEQYWYCTDIVDQGTETIDALAAVLMNNSAWFFWWD